MTPENRSPQCQRLVSTYATQQARLGLGDDVGPIDPSEIEQWMRDMEDRTEDVRSWGGERARGGRRRDLQQPTGILASGGFTDALSRLDSLFDMDSLLEPVRSRLSKMGSRFSSLSPAWFGDDTPSKPWYDGPHVCVDRTETEEEEVELRGSGGGHLGVVSTTACEEGEETYTCTASLDVYGRKKTVTVTYRCCYGYMRLAGELGCPKELTLTDLASTARSLSLTNFLEAANEAKLTDGLKDGNFTIFAPSDDAFKEYTPSERRPSPNIVLVSADSAAVATETRSLLAAHLVEGFRTSDRLPDETTMDTLYPTATVRVNHYNTPDGQRLMTANCVRVTSSDQRASNGVIHVLARVMPTATATVLETVQRHPQLTTLASLLEKTGLASMLSERPGQFTLFAPTDAAFARLDPRARDNIMNGATSCLANTVRSHVVKNVICSSAVTVRGRTKNILDAWIHLNRSTDATEDSDLASDLFVEGARVSRRDVMATNGVIHVIDDVIIPQHAVGVLESASAAGLSRVLDLLDQAGLAQELSRSDNVTLFLPTDDAIDSLSASQQRLLGDQQVLQQVLRTHVVPGARIAGNELLNGRTLTTLNSGVNAGVKEYSSFPFSLSSVKTVQCAPIVRTDIESCNARIHVVSKVLFPPAGDIVHVLSLDSRFSTLMMLLKEAGIAEKLQLDGPFTFFAPTNDAFAALDQELLSDLRQNKRKLAGFLAHHITHDTLCCAGMSLPSASSASPWWFRPTELTLDPGSTLVLERRHGNGAVLVDSTEVAECDVMATNGVVHVIQQVLPSAGEKFGVILPRRRGYHGDHSTGDWIGRFFDDAWRQLFPAPHGEE
jgi:transforming growth factor-beta-induced protein